MELMDYGALDLPCQLYMQLLQQHPCTPASTCRFPRLPFYNEEQMLLFCRLHHLILDIQEQFITYYVVCVRCRLRSLVWSRNGRCPLSTYSVLQTGALASTVLLLSGFVRPISPTFDTTTFVNNVRFYIGCEGP